MRWWKSTTSHYTTSHHLTPPHSTTLLLTPPHSTTSSLLLTPPPPHSSSSLLVLTTPPDSSSSLLLLTPPPHSSSSKIRPDRPYITTLLIDCVQWRSQPDDSVPLCKYCHVYKLSTVYNLLREPLSSLIKYKTIGTPKIESILKIYFDVSTKL